MTDPSNKQRLRPHEQKDHHEILLVGDFAGVGKVSFSVMTPLLTAKNRTLSYLPTAVVSNSFDYGDAVVYELTDYMAQTLEIWQKHQFQFDLLITGFLFSQAQVAIIKRLIAEQEKPPFLIADPIMGDWGELYSGLSHELVAGMRDIVALADLIIPNLTEALLILGEEQAYHHVTEAKVYDWLKSLHEMGAQSILITSVKILDQFYIFGYCAREDRYFKIPYQMIPIHFGGTGDIFTALITNALLTQPELSLERVVTHAAKVVSAILEQEETYPREKIDEVYFQRYLNELRAMIPLEEMVD